MSNDKRPIKVSIKFYVPTHILNLRATGEHCMKLFVGHFGPHSPHVKLRLNGREERKIQVVKSDMDNESVAAIRLDLECQDIRKYNLLEITVFNKPDYYALKFLDLQIKEQRVTKKLVESLVHKIEERRIKEAEEKEDEDEEGDD